MKSIVSFFQLNPYPAVDDMYGNIKNVFGNELNLSLTLEETTLLSLQEKWFYFIYFFVQFIDSSKDYKISLQVKCKA